MENISKNREMIISFTDISLKYKQKKQSLIKKSLIENKYILKQVSGYFRKGINAILGSSGAGKTSLLNVIAKRIQNSHNTELEGQIQINNRSYNYSQFNNLAGYVMQDDYLLPTLTVKEYFQFAADMKLSIPDKDKFEKVINLIQKLQLTNCQNTLIGNVMTKGISGGERKRCSIGIELLGEPQILVLDEPTSGLDSFTSYRLICLLKSIAERDNCTIIFTIHQPSSDIWNLFDRVCLLADGKFVYQGKRENIIEYFNTINFKCPRYSNPADYFISLISEIGEQSTNRFKYLTNQYSQQLEQNVNETILKLNSNNLTQINFVASINKINRISQHYMLKKLLLRQIKLLSRNKIMIYARFMQVIIMSLFTGAVYFNLSRDYNSYTDSYNIAIFLYVIMLGQFSQSETPQVINFSAERPVYLKEVNQNLYTTGAYFLSKIIPEIVTCSIFPIIMGLIVYWMVGMTTSAFPFYLLVYILQSNVGNSFGILSGSIFEQPKVAISFATTFLIPQLLFGGLFKNRNDYSSWIGWIQYITPTFYAFNAAAVNEFEQTNFLYNPILYLNLDLNKWVCVGMLATLYILFNFIAFLILSFKKKNLQ
ncbi:ABC transporter family protein (macronuclear) [Tetrahymena thermophila SB210]|uniref:ABC transporter family protein n=1 Tax=Tetrahymena thermophila (strain SB210) TaxID=312017 RepID=Q24F66_TETTS|nr:ABC transporter family protein [Tetrahymena thermophila SB210]EAS06409.2 ABC transporter family protein [Tetrahymena thermophila SB210]|eukprot:XP_001026654.2 ABC transporter family protein [Tetrahymena thermophila SB210]